MITREQIIDEARRWLGTPYQHQATLRGVGVDCGGLLRGVALAVGALPPDWLTTEFVQHAGYAREPSGGSLVATCDAFMVRIDPTNAMPGDALAFRYSGVPRHLGLLVPYALGGLSVIHALATARKVVEHRFADVWRARVTHAWRMPGVE